MLLDPICHKKCQAHAATGLPLEQNRPMLQCEACCRAGYMCSAVWSGQTFSAAQSINTSAGLLLEEWPRSETPDQTSEPQLRPAAQEATVAAQAQSAPGSAAAQQLKHPVQVEAALEWNA